MVAAQFNSLDSWEIGRHTTGSSQSDPGAECHNVRPDPHSGREEVWC